MSIRTGSSSRLEEFLTQPAPAAAVLLGEPLSGKSTLLRFVESRGGAGRAVRIRGSLLPSTLLARELTSTVRRQLQESSSSSGPAPAVSRAQDSRRTTAPGETEWAELFHVLMSFGDSATPRLLIVDDADPLLRDRRFVQDLRRWWSEMRSGGTPLHLILAVRRSETLEALTDASVEAPPLRVGLREELHPLSLREAADCVPAWSARACVETYALVGGFPAFWHAVDDGVRPETNLARLFLSPGGKLRRMPWSFLSASTTVGERPMGIIHALANGATRWGDIRKAAGAFRSSAELGPYMTTLQDDGLVVARRSLDALPSSRRTRYQLAHPILSFWYGAVHPHLASLDGHTPARAEWKSLLAVARRRAMLRSLPFIVGQYLHHHGRERLSAPAREVGGLWGDGYDIPVAGTLETGAVVYAAMAWRKQDPTVLDRLLEQIRRTPYGFGRESRVPVVVVRDPPSHDLDRRIAREPGALLISDRDLVGR